MKRFRIDACSLERFPGDFEKNPLLRVDAESFSGADAEEGVIEICGVVKEASTPRVRLPGGVGVGIVDVGRPSAIGGEAVGQVASFQERGPQLLRRTNG